MKTKFCLVFAALCLTPLAMAQFSSDHKYREQQEDQERFRRQSEQDAQRIDTELRLDALERERRARQRVADQERKNAEMNETIASLRKRPSYQEENLEAAKKMAEAADALAESRARRLQQQRLQLEWQREDEAAQELAESRARRIQQQRLQLERHSEDDVTQERRAIEKKTETPRADPNYEQYAKEAAEKRKGANEGDARCQMALGAHYALGRGLPKDFVLSYMWFNLAAASSDNPNVAGIAASAREKIARDMPPEQIAEAQRMSREWKPAKDAAENVRGQPVTDPELIKQLDAAQEAAPPQK